MAANQAALNNYLQDTLGFPEDLPEFLTLRDLMHSTFLLLLPTKM
jgi:hypothetical protein